MLDGRAACEVTSRFLSAEVVELAVLDSVAESAPLAGREEELRAVRVFRVAENNESFLVGLVRDRITGDIEHSDLNTVGSAVAAEAALAPLDTGEVHHGLPDLPSDALGEPFDRAGDQRA